MVTVPTANVNMHNHRLSDGDSFHTDEEAPAIILHS